MSDTQEQKKFLDDPTNKLLLGISMILVLSLILAVIGYSANKKVTDDMLDPNRLAGMERLAEIQKKMQEISTPLPSTEVRYHFCPPQYISPDPGTKWCTDNSGERCNFPPSESRRLCAIFTGSSIENVTELP